MERSRSRPDASTGRTSRELDDEHTPIRRGRPSILGENTFRSANTSLRHLAVIWPRLSFNRPLSLARRTGAAKFCGVGNPVRPGIRKLKPPTQAISFLHWEQMDEYFRKNHERDLRQSHRRDACR